MKLKYRIFSFLTGILLLLPPVPVQGTESYEANFPPLRTYQFQIQDQNGVYQPYYFPVSGTKKVCQQTVANHEKPVIPQLPENPDSHAVFAGWYDENGNLFDFETIPEVTQTETVILHAVFQNYAYAVFHNQYDTVTDSFPVSAVRRGELTDQTAEIKIQDMTVSYDMPESSETAVSQMAFKGWSKEPVSQAGAVLTDLGNPVRIETEPFLISETAHLYPVFEKISWLIFDTGETGSGATYIPPESFFSEEGFLLSDIPVPERSGYVFDGWYTQDQIPVTDSEGNLLASGSSDDFEIKNHKLYLKNQSELTLSAHWSPGLSDYTVIIWKQKATDSPDLPDTEKSYDFSESFTLSTLTGSIVTVDDSDKNYQIPGFAYSHCSDALTADGTGNTILDVYYDRNIHTFTFRNHNRVIKTVRALYGADISHIWNFTGSDGISYPRTDINFNTSWTPGGSAQYTQRLTQMLLMPDEDITFTYTSTSHTKRYFHYYAEALPEAETVRIYRQKNYVPCHENLETVENDFNYLYYEEDFLQIEGFTRFETAAPDGTQVIIDQHTEWENNWNHHLYFYYTRNSYPIEFINSVNSQILAETSLPYQQNTENFLPDDPRPPTGFQFTGWYADPACSVRVFFHEPSETEIDSSRDSSGVPHYQVYETMPAFPLRVYAGWETQWFLIEIDPNGGELADGQSTWFWEPYQGDPVTEYTQTVRNYIPDPDGDYYYMLHDRNYYHLDQNWNIAENSISDRRAGYTADLSEAVNEVRYRKSPGNYKYLGWYRVNPDTGEETPYHFGTRVTENLFLRLHWKQTGIYYIQYDAGEGQLPDDTQQIFAFPDTEQYSDQADLFVTRTAVPPEGKNFIGWKIKLDPEQKIYTPGQSFRFDSALTEPIQEKQTLIMQAVYQEIPTANIIYDVNGGAILPDADAGKPVISLIEPEYQRSDTLLTVSDLLNHSAVQISSGTGFQNGNYILLGWNTEKDGSGTAYPPGSILYVNAQMPVILYAQWGSKIIFDKNNSHADWGGEWQGYQQENNTYYQIINFNTNIKNPADMPVSSDSDEIFCYWSADQQTPFDFSQPVTQDILTLYGYWAKSANPETTKYEESSVTVTLEEQTIALPEDMNQKFQYTASVKQEEIKNIYKIYYYKINDNYIEISRSEESETSDIIQISEKIISLSDEESEAFVLSSSYSASGTELLSTSDMFGNYPVYEQEFTEIRTIQNIEILQEQNENFITCNNTETSGSLRSSASSENPEDQKIIYYNTQNPRTEFHVAVMEHNILYDYDAILRTEKQSVYQQILPAEKCLYLYHTDQLITDTENYRFSGIISGSKNKAGHIIPQKQNLTSVTFGEISRNLYQCYLNQDSSQILNPEEEIWFVYVPFSAPVTGQHENPEIYGIITGTALCIILVLLLKYRHISQKG
ncbi:MAG: InlB B-repeat-containing protein [Oscillospiraceae bacterium]|nr:InlB B-repeat-containing protein [Oscillospiraceae bacterium]